MTILVTGVAGFIGSNFVYYYLRKYKDRKIIGLDKLFVNSENCCGCTACISIYPKQAISMIPDEEGFLYPKIDESLCINCELCKNVCAFQRNLVDYDTSRRPLMAFAGVLKDTHVLKNSASGGAFTALAFSFFK